MGEEPRATSEVRLSESPKGEVGMYRGHWTGKEGKLFFLNYLDIAFYSPSLSHGALPQLRPVPVGTPGVSLFLNRPILEE